jgi:hypothetical protein
LGCRLIKSTLRCKTFVSLISGAYAVVCGLIPDTVILSALDNLLFLSVFPFFIIRVQLFIRGNRSWSSIFGLALTSSAAFYSYPEGLAVAGVVFLPICAFSLVQILRRDSAWRRCLLLVGLSILLILPYLATFFSFLRNQISAAAGHVGRGAMPGLLSNRFLPSVFGFGDEFLGGPLEISHLVLGGICVGFIALAMLRQRRKNRAILLCSVFFLIACAVWQGLILRYDYGLFKFLVVGSLLTIPLIFCGIQVGSRLFCLKNMPVAAPAIALLVSYSAFAERRETKDDYFSYWSPKIGPYSDLSMIKEVVGDSPVRLSFENGVEMPTFEAYVNGLDQLWAAYFLRDVILTYLIPGSTSKGISNDRPIGTGEKR